MPRTVAPVTKNLKDQQLKSKTKSKSIKKVLDSSPSVSPSKVSNGSNGKANISKKARLELAEAQKSKPVDSKQKSLSPEKKVTISQKTQVEIMQKKAKNFNKVKAETNDKAESISPRQKSPEPKSQSPRKNLRNLIKQAVSPSPEEQYEAIRGFDISDICQMVKPKKPHSVFLIYSIQRRPQLQAENPDLSLTEVTKLIGKEWTMISSGQKQELNLLAEKDIQRYQKEMEQFETHGWFINSNGEKSIDLMLQNPKFYDDVVQPTKPKNAYICFLQEEVQSLKKNDPSIKHTDTYKLCGLKWNAMSLKDQEKYQLLSEQDNIRYKSEIRQLLTVGYFVDYQGVKSTDKQVKLKKVQHVTQQSFKSDNTTAPTFGSLKAQSQVSTNSSSSQKKKVSQKVQN